MSTRDDVIALIESWNLTLPKNWDRDTSLVRSGISRSIRRSSIWLTSWILSPASRILWRKTVAADSTPRMVDGYEIVRYRPEHKSQVAKLQLISGPANPNSRRGISSGSMKKILTPKSP